MPIAGGLEALTMRQLAEMLDVAPMALYRHVANKDDLIDAMIDVVFGEIGLPSGGADWKTAMRERALSLCDVLARHRWAVGLMESRRSPGPANLRHHDAVIGKLRRQASTSRWLPTPTRCWTATSTASPSRR